MSDRSEFAPSPERTADLMTKAMEQIGETAKKAIAEIIDAHKAETDHMHECFLHFQEEIVTFVEKAKEEVRASAHRCNRLREQAEQMMVEFRDSIPVKADEKPRDLDEPVPGFLLREPPAPPRKLLESASAVAHIVGIVIAVGLIAIGLPRV